MIEEYGKDRTGPNWLDTWQKNFTSAIRSPLDFSNGTFQASAQIAAPYVMKIKATGIRDNFVEGLKIYNRQYWFRLFSVMQNELPLTARLLGFWTFNLWAQRYLLQYPPNDVDIAKVAEHFATFLENHARDSWIPIEGSSKSVPKEALIESTLVDRGWHQILHAPACTRWQPDAEMLGDIRNLQLKMSPRVSFISQSWPWMQNREAIIQQDGEVPICIPPKLEKTESWILIATDSNISQWPLSSPEAQFYKLLMDYPISQAMQLWESLHPGVPPELLAPEVTTWISGSMDWGMWIGYQST